MTFVQLYPWLKAMHLASVMVFVGGVLSVSVFLASAAPAAPPASLARAVLRWDGRVTAPAMLLVWALGLTLAVGSGRFADLWLQAKLVFVVLLSGFHAVQTGRLRRALRDGGKAVAVPGTGIGISAAMFTIALLAVVKPF